MKVKKMNSTLRSRSLTVGLVLLAALSSHAGSNYVINKYVIASGGESRQGPYVLNGAIGQSTTTRSTSATYQVTAGFYQENRDLIFFNEFENTQFFNQSETDQ